MWTLSYVRFYTTSGGVYDQEKKEEAVKLVTEKGYQVSEAARNLGILTNMLSRWKREILVDDESSSGTDNLNDVQAELQRLRKENKRLKMEREILKKAAAFFTKESD